MGFIGSRVVSRLVERGESVVVLDSLEAQVHRDRPPELASEVELLVGTVGDVDLADRALRGVDRVVHLAAVVGVGQSMYEIARYVRMNSLATATFLERLVAMDKRPRRLVVASSMSIYGEGSYECPEHGQVVVGPRPEKQLLARDWEPRCAACSAELSSIPTAEDKQLLPTSVYAVTKRDHEELALVVGAAYGIPTVALRFFNVYGPGQALSNPYTGVAAIFSSRLINGNPPLIFEDGAQSRDFIHVDDIVTGVLLSARVRTRRRKGDKPGDRTPGHDPRGSLCPLSWARGRAGARDHRRVPSWRYPALLCRLALCGGGARFSRPHRPGDRYGGPSALGSRTRGRRRCGCGGCGASLVRPRSVILRA